MRKISRLIIISLLFFFTQIEIARSEGVSVFGLKNVNFGRVSARQTNVQVLPLCVVASSSPFYFITIKGEAIGNHYILRNNNNNFVRLVLAWNDKSSGANGAKLKPGVPEGSFIANANSRCGNNESNSKQSFGRNSALVLSVFPGDLNSVPAGQYSTTLTLIVSRA